MADNSDVVVTIIDTAATSQQYKILSDQLDTLDQQFVNLTKEVIAFNKAAADAKGFSDFNKNTAAASIATEKLIQTQNQSAIVKTKLAQEEAKLEIVNKRSIITANSLAKSNASLQTSQERATAATQKALSPYQQLSKELDRQRLAAKDLGLQYGTNSSQFKKAQEDVLKLDNQLKKLDSSLGQNQRNVGNYENSIKDALGSLYGAIDRVIPGAGALTRTVVEGFQKITSEATNARNAITDSIATPGGFGFKPNTEGEIENTGVTVLNTEAVTANTAANEANIASEVERGKVVESSTASTIEQTAATAESSTALELLGSGFAGFTTAVFIAAIGSATYYLSQFKSTANTVSVFTAGLKSQFASIGESVVERFKIIKQAIKDGTSINDALNKLQDQAEKADKRQGKSGDAGEDAQRRIIALQNATEIDEIENAQLQAEAEKGRALSKDKNTQIDIRQKYLKDAQGVEQKILDNEKRNADQTVETAIQVGNKLKTLSAAQIKQLKDAAQKGDLKPAQNLALNGQQFTEEGFELYKQGIAKQIAYQAGAANEIIKLQADADNMELRADNALAKAQDRLDKARVQSALDKAKLVLDSETATYSQRLKASKTFVDNTIKLLKIQEKNELDTAGLGGARSGKDSRVEAVTRAAIAKETQNAINKAVDEGQKQRLQIEKKSDEALRVLFKSGAKDQVDIEQDAIAKLNDANNEKLKQLSDFENEQENILAKRYIKGEITEKEYNDKLVSLKDDYNVKRLTQIAALSKAEYELRKGSSNVQIQNAVDQGASPEDVAGLQTDNSKAITDAANKAAQDQINADNALTKQQLDNVKKVETAKTQLADLEKQIAAQSLDLIKSIVDNAYQAEIDALKEKAQQVDENASQEKETVNDALLSSKQKAQQNKLIDAQTASQKKQIQNEENRIKTKQAEFDKAINIAQIIEQGGVAEVSALKYLADPITAPFYPAIAILIGALTALNLTKTIATPIPKYAKGTKNHPGGLGIVGDAGSEYVRYPDGYSFISPNKATVLDMPEGTTVVPNLETVRSINKIRYAGGEAIDMREVQALLKENNRYQKRIAEKPAPGNAGLVNALVQAQAIADRQKAYFK